MTNRRAFLRTLLAGTAGSVAYALDPDLLLWQPGAKTIFLPSVVPENYGEMVAMAWESVMAGHAIDDIFTSQALTVMLARPLEIGPHTDTWPLYE